MRLTYLHPVLASAVALVLSAPIAAPVAAQPMTIVTEGVLGPCTQNHFEPARYLSDLAEAGWRPVPEEGLPIAVELLSEAFLTVTNPGVDGRTDPLPQRLEAATAFWQQQTEGRVVLMNFDSVLFLRGFTDAEGSQLLDCWLVTPDGDFVDDLIAQADSDAAEVTDRGVGVALGPDPLDNRTTLALVATRQPLPEGTSYGLHTQLVRVAEE